MSKKHIANVVPSDEDNNTGRAATPQAVLPTEQDPNTPITLAMMKELLAPINQKLDHLIAASPHAAMTLRNTTPLVGTRGEHVDNLTCSILYGATATWTYMLIKGSSGEKDTKIAVSCEHCALPYKVVGRGGKQWRFVSVPLELIECGIVSVGLGSEHLYGPQRYVQDNREDRNDISIVILREFPEHIQSDKVPEWPLKVDDTNFPAELIVSGFSPTGAVHGSHCALGSGCYLFVENSGEPGNSGTLMYLCFPGKTVLLGLYLGTRTVVNLKQRGRICPFPDPGRLKDEFRQHPPTPAKGAPDKLRIQTAARTKKHWRPKVDEFDKVQVGQGVCYRRSGRSDYGVLVNATGKAWPSEKKLV